VSLDAELAAALRRDYREADLTAQDRARLDFTAKLTKEAYKTTPDDLASLRDVGFDDRAILQITMIAA
jgi:alkylhydroperoxidase family enzyme